MKKLFGEDGFKGFIVQHVEKLLLGLVTLISLFLIWSGFKNSTADAISATQTPEKLVADVNQAQSHIDRFTWNDFKDQPERNAKEGYKQRAAEAQQKISEASFKTTRLLNPPYQPPRQMRLDPELYAVENLQVRTYFARIEKPMRAVRNGDGDPLDEQGPGRDGGFGQRRSEFDDENPNERPIPDRGGFREGGSRRGYGASGKAEGVYFVSVTGLIPYRRQVEEYNRCFQNSVGYNPQRDMPNYLDFRLYRAEVVPGKKPKFKAIAAKKTINNTVKEWGVMGAWNGCLAGWRPWRRRRT